MAKLSENSHSATSQWFINVEDNTDILDNQNGGFTVFSEVESFSVIDEIMAQNIINVGGVFGDLPVKTTRDDGGTGAKSAAEVVVDDFITIRSIKVVRSGNTAVPESGSVSLLLLGSEVMLLRKRR